MDNIWAGWYITRLLVKLAPEAVVFSFLVSVDNSLVELLKHEQALQRAALTADVQRVGVCDAG